MENQKRQKLTAKERETPLKRSTLSDGGEYISVKPHNDDFSDQDHKENFDFDKAKGYKK